MYFPTERRTRTPLKRQLTSFISPHQRINNSTQLESIIHAHNNHRMSMNESSSTSTADIPMTKGTKLKTTIPSPIQLSHIQDFPSNSTNNTDTVKLRDILGDPLIRECWQFNYMFDVDFLMDQFDEDVRRDVKVKVVHGSWRRDSSNRMDIDVCFLSFLFFFFFFLK